MDSSLDSLVHYYGRVMMDSSASELIVACSPYLERKLLDYGVQSLDAIDRYLIVVNGAQEGIPMIAYANAIIGTAIYVGEVIRRNAPSTEFSWGRIEKPESEFAASLLEISDLSDLALRSSTTGIAISPADPILLRIRHGLLAPAVKEFAVAAIRHAWVGSSNVK